MKKRLRNTAQRKSLTIRFGIGESYAFSLKQEKGIHERRVRKKPGLATGLI